MDGIACLTHVLWKKRCTGIVIARVPIAKERRKGQSMLPGAVHQIINVEQH
jgi:hypothetical protein